MTETADTIRSPQAIALKGARQAGLPHEAALALAAMRPCRNYRLDRFPHPAGGSLLVGLGLAYDISSHYAGDIRGATLSPAGEILRGAIHGVDPDRD